VKFAPVTCPPELRTETSRAFRLRLARLAGEASACANVAIELQDVKTAERLTALATTIAELADVRRRA
jgi:hypothetical protein